MTIPHGVVFLYPRAMGSHATVPRDELRPSDDGYRGGDC